MQKIGEIKGVSVGSDGITAFGLFDKIGAIKAQPLPWHQRAVNAAFRYISATVGFLLVLVLLVPFAVLHGLWHGWQRLFELMD
jgi:hypothetical protein